MRENQDWQLRLQISPEEYGKQRERVLGNHFIHAKVSPSLKWNDRRLEFLNPEYFRGKTVLDIGCNEGVLTLPIAIKFQPKLIRGIDVDPQMIKALNRNKQHFIEKNRRYQLPKEYIEDIRQLPQYFREKLESKFGTVISEIDEKYEILPRGQEGEGTGNFPNNIEARPQNVFAMEEREAYQCILCMNVTKWVHLAYGDTAIKELFRVMEGLLAEGGILVIEAQPWHSYRKKKNLFSSYSENYRMILQKPERFGEQLRKLGLQQVEAIEANRSNELKHDILVFQKRGGSR